MLLRMINKVYYHVLQRISPEKYKEKYPQYLKKLGIKISDNYFQSGHGFIASSAVFDANDYSLISIGDATTISADVVFLTHDYSIAKGLAAVNSPYYGRFLKPISVGENCFIGMRTILLPGTTIGNNCIVGAGAVVKGNYPDHVVIAGNPAKVICTIEEFTNRHIEMMDFQILN